MLLIVLTGMMPSAVCETPSKTGRTPYVTKECRMDRSRLNIGTYTLQSYARSEAHVRDLARCGIDFVIGMDNDRETLDLFGKYGVRGGGDQLGLLYGRVVAQPGAG